MKVHTVSGHNNRGANLYGGVVRHQNYANDVSLRHDQSELETPNELLADATTNYFENHFSDWENDFDLGNIETEVSEAQLENPISNQNGNSCPEYSIQDGIGNIKPRKKPLTPYMLFSTENFNKVKEEIGVNNASVVGTVMGERWRKLNESEKKPYQDKANEMKLHYSSDQSVPKVKSSGVTKKRAPRRGAAKNVAMPTKSEKNLQNQESVSSQESVGTNSPLDGLTCAEISDLTLHSSRSPELLQQNFQPQYPSDAQTFPEFGYPHPGVRPCYGQRVAAMPNVSEPRSADWRHPLNHHHQNYDTLSMIPPHQQTLHRQPLHYQNYYQVNQYMVQSRNTLHMPSGHVLPASASLEERLPHMSREQLVQIIIEQKHEKNIQDGYISELIKENIHLKGSLSRQNSYSLCRNSAMGHRQ